MKIPELGIGTWLLYGNDCERVVQQALRIGYRHIDTAFAYENHRAVAKGMKGVVSREKIFLTTKFMVEQTSENSVEALCDQALQELETDYIDLFLIHWPDRNYPLQKILEDMFRLVEKGKIHSPGVSNYTQHHLQDAYDAGLKVPFNQVEFHPYLSQENLRSFCSTHGTQLIGFRPFGKGQLFMDEPLFKEIGNSYGKSPSQIILRWILEKGVPCVPKASSEKHLKENFNIFDFSLTPEDIKKIDGLNKNVRYCEPEWNEFDY